MEDDDLGGLIELARAGLHAAALADALDALGCRSQALPPGIRPLDETLVLCGRARVGLYMPIYAEDPHAYDEEMRLIDDLRPGDVPVLACQGNLRVAPWGELLSTRAAFLGAAGCLTDGCVRDLHAIRAMRFPVFAGGINPTDSKCRGRMIAADVPARIGEVEVASGDLVFGDVDGVVVIPRAVAAQAVEAASAKVRAEGVVRDELRAGSSLADAFRRHGVL